MKKNILNIFCVFFILVSSSSWASLWSFKKDLEDAIEDWKESTEKMQDLCEEAQKKKNLKSVSIYDSNGICIASTQEDNMYKPISASLRDTFENSLKNDEKESFCSPDGTSNKFLPIEVDEKVVAVFIIED